MRRFLCVEVPAEFSAWLGEAALSEPDQALGLFDGLGGIASVLLELGETERANHLATHALSSVDPSRLDKTLWSGLAGLGMTALRFAQVGEAGGEFVDSAERIAAALSQDDPAGRGYARGGSGRAVFLTELYRTTGQARYLDAARSALLEDLLHVSRLGAGLSVARAAMPGTVSPYLMDGSAGVAAACLRIGHLADDAKLLATARALTRDCDRRFSVFAGLFQGLTGLGVLLLEMDDLEAGGYRDSSLRLAASVLNFSIPVVDGLAFPGDGLSSISFDFASGSAGIALFLARLLGAAQPTLSLFHA
jgi:lantibiotic modifying enzyme